jgi:hypothetical protein
MKRHWMTSGLNGVFAAGLVAGLALQPGAARAAFPDKPITMIVPFGPGGSFDKLARNLQDGLQKGTQRCHRNQERARRWWPPRQRRFV